MIRARLDDTRTKLQDLLTRAHAASLQLPDFQRGWVWDNGPIKDSLLCADRFWHFYALRAKGLLTRIESATRKIIAREPELFGASAVPERYDEDPEKWDAEEPLEKVGC